MQLKIEGVDWTITEAMVELENYIKELTRHEQKKQLHFLDVEMKQSFVGKFSQLVGKKLEIGEND